MIIDDSKDLLKYYLNRNKSTVFKSNILQKKYIYLRNLELF